MERRWEHLDRVHKEFVDEWRQAAGTVSDSTRRQIMVMRKSGKSVRKICSALELPVETVCIIVIEEYAKELGETPLFIVCSYLRYTA